MAASPIVGGEASDSSQDAVVLIIHHVVGSEVDQVCSGTLLAPNLVLTARHCVASADSTSQCSSSGTSLTGGQVHGDYDPSELHVFAGATRPTNTSLAGRTQQGSEIVDDGSTMICNRDIAFIVLETPVPNAKIAPIRLDTATAAKEPVRLVGWGITDETGKIPTTRQQRTGVSVLEVGPADGLGSSELVVGEGPCGGDSGGPALAASGAVIGSLSRGGNGSTEGGVASCIGGTSIYTEVAGFKDLALSAYSRAGATPWLESQPNPQGTMTTPSNTQSGGCATQPEDGSRVGGAGAAAIMAVLGLAVLRARRRALAR